MNEELMDQISVACSDDGRIFVFDGRDDFMASFSGGRWVADQLFVWADLEENFNQPENEAEILRILTEARIALGQPSTSREPKPKSA